MITDDTIAAISSPPGRSLRGLLRASGPACRQILEHLLIDGRALPGARRLEARRVNLSDTNELPLELPVLLAFFRGPASYSGQDMLEIQCPGNPHLLDRLLHRMFQLGARLAEPGEFTLRAFLSGKMDLTQAEGVAATIAAVGDAHLKAAALLRCGELGQLARSWADRLATQLAKVEAGIDFTDQDGVVPVTPAELDPELAGLERSLGELLSRCRSFTRLGELPRAALAGPPNAGKSTLFNALLGRQRAVTAPLAGTTRDVLAEPLTLATPTGPAQVLLCDLAGLDDAQSAAALDALVQQAARQAIQHADLVVLLSAPDTPAWPSEAIQTSGGILNVRAKGDLSSPSNDCPGSDLVVSAATGAGLQRLRQMIAQRLADRAVSLSGEALALSPRHETALRAAAQHLRAARQLLNAQPTDGPIRDPELVAERMRAALDELHGLAGRLTPDDVLARVFATFCIGK